MATVEETLSYFDPKEVKEYKKLVPGTYKSNIVKFKSKEGVPIRKKFQANIYNYYVKLDATHEDFAGREVRSAGVFFFLSPGEFDNFKANPGGNAKYFEFIDACGVSCPEQTIEVDGEERVVKTLPIVESYEVLGSPVLATLGFGKPWTGNDGVERKSLEVKSLSKWKEGNNVDVEAEELPF